MLVRHQVLGLLSRKFALSLTTAVLETNLAQFLDVRLGVTGPLLGLVFSYLGACHWPLAAAWSWKKRASS